MAPGKRQSGQKIHRAWVEYRDHERLIEEWNTKNNVGTLVDYRLTLGSDKNMLTTKTDSDTFMSESGHPVIFLSGKSGFVSLLHISKRDK